MIQQIERPKQQNFLGRLVNPHILLPVSLFIVLGGIIMSQPQKEKPITPGSVYRLSASEIEAVRLEAMLGSGDAAQRLFRHYNFTPNDNGYVLAREWELIGAENGHLILQYNTALWLSYPTYNPNARVIFWLRLAANNGNESARNKLVKDFNTSLEFDFPPDSSFPNTYKEMTAEKIITCEEGALQGNGKAALLLANYYNNTVKDADLAEYWYRIGAQNGNPECQYSLGHIYQAKPEMVNKTRGTFWLEKATQNGYTVVND